MASLEVAAEPAGSVGIVSCGAIAYNPDDAGHDGREPHPDTERVMWISEGAPIGYLPEIARNALGHSWT